MSAKFVPVHVCGQVMGYVDCLGLYRSCTFFDTGSSFVCGHFNACRDTCVTSCQPDCQCGSVVNASQLVLGAGISSKGADFPLRMEFGDTRAHHSLLPPCPLLPPPPPPRCDEDVSDVDATRLHDFHLYYNNFLSNNSRKLSPSSLPLSLFSLPLLSSHFLLFF